MVVPEPGSGNHDYLPPHETAAPDWKARLAELALFLALYVGG
jgi:hypothetical protein